MSSCAPCCCSQATETRQLRESARNSPAEDAPLGRWAAGAQPAISQLLFSFCKLESHLWYFFLSVTHFFGLLSLQHCHSPTSSLSVFIEFQESLLHGNSVQISSHLLLGVFLKMNVRLLLCSCDIYLFDLDCCEIVWTLKIYQLIGLTLSF